MNNLRFFSRLRESTKPFSSVNIFTNTGVIIQAVDLVSIDDITLGFVDSDNVSDIILKMRVTMIQIFTFYPGKKKMVVETWYH